MVGVLDGRFVGRELGEALGLQLPQSAGQSGDNPRSSHSPGEYIAQNVESGLP